MGKPGTPESFKVLIKELRSLGLDLKLLTQSGKEVNFDEESKGDGRGDEKKAKGFFSRGIK